MIGIEHSPKGFIKKVYVENSFLFTYYVIIQEGFEILYLIYEKVI